MRLESKVALITGGYGGMGRASARLFAKEGATVFIAGRNTARGEALAAEINGNGGKAHFLHLDVVDQAGWDSAVEQIRSKARALHILMNIVGSNALVRLPHVEIDEWNKVFDTNVTATLRGIQTCAPLMKESGGGSIVNIGLSRGLRVISRPPTPLRSGRSKACRDQQPMSTPTGESAAMSSSRGGSKPILPLE